MRTSKRSIVLAVIAMAGIANLALGLAGSNPLAISVGGVGLSYAMLQFATQASRKRRVARLSESKSEPVAETARAQIPATPNVSPDDTEGLARQMLEQGRYALLLRPQVASNLDAASLEQARDVLHDAMSLVPQGEVTLGQQWHETEEGEQPNEHAAGRIVPVAPLFLDRYPVTNRQYFEFVAAGGYEQIPLWDPSVWSEVLSFVDQSKHPGPAFWNGGCFEPGKENHPVIGVSWHEACAYARWVGKRLPTDAEWVKAGSWPVRLSASTCVQRKYPWGDAMDRTLAALWDADRNGTVSVTELSDGASIGGVYHLIGNVWEWMRGDYRPEEVLGDDIYLDVPLKSIRGGAFDTYFDSHATCHFQSGDAAIARKHNIGFRCAVGICDLALAPQSTPNEEEADSTAAEEVLA